MGGESLLDAEDAFLELTAPRRSHRAEGRPAAVPNPIVEAAFSSTKPAIPAQPTSGGPEDWDTQTFDVIADVEADRAGKAN